MPYIGVSPQFGVRRKHTYTATTGQTSFSGAGAEGTSLSYKDSNFVDVYQNGVKLGDADYTSTSGTAIVLAQGASVDDLVEIIVFDAFSAADTVSKADGGTFDGNVTMAGTLDVTGNGTVGGTLAVTGETTLATHLNMGDNDKIKLGASGDLEIYHDTNHSYIEDTGTGELRLKSDGTAIIFQHDGTSSNREIKAFFSVSTGTSNTTIFTVDTGSQHSGYYYEVICYAGDWSGHSSARVIKRGFINGYDGYTGHDSIESDGPYASNIIENISWNGTSGETTYQLRLDTGSVVLTGMVRIVGTISGFTITN
jgi:hypothetical protein